MASWKLLSVDPNTNLYIFYRYKEVMQKLVSNWLLQINSFSVMQIGDDVYLRVLYVFYDIFT